MAKSKNVKENKLSLKYCYYYLWILFAFLFNRLIAWLGSTTIKLICFVFRKSEEEEAEALKNFNKIYFDFPNGFIDWVAFGFLAFFVFMPIVLLFSYFNIEFILLKSLTHFLLASLPSDILVYYIIYFRDISWLKRKINKAKKKYYI